MKNQVTILISLVAIFSSEILAAQENAFLLNCKKALEIVRKSYHSYGGVYSIDSLRLS